MMLRAPPLFRGFFVTLLSLVGAARAESTLKEFVIDADGEIDSPRIHTLFGAKEGDVVTEATLEQGLARVAQSGGRFQGLRATFDAATGRLVLELRLGNRIQDIDLRIVPGPLAESESVPEELADDLRQVLGVNRGDIVTAEVLGELRARLMARLRDRGYLGPQVVLALEERARGTGRVLFASIETGPRAIVRALRLKGFTVSDVDEFLSTLRSESDFRQIVEGILDPARNVLQRGGSESSVVDETREIPVQMPLDWISVSESTNQWAQQARQRGYYDFRVSLEVERETDDRLALLVSLERGPRYDIQFRGNVAFWENQLREKVTDRSVRLGIPFSIPDAEAIVKRMYLAEGAKDVSIATSIEEHRGLRRILFDVDEGRFLFVRDFYFDRGADAERELAARILKEWRQANQNPLRKIPFDERLLKSWTPDLVRRFRAEGFLQARVLEMRPSFRDGSRVVDVEIALQLGFRSRVREISVIGNVGLAEVELDRLIDIEVGEWANPDKIAETAARLRDAYLELGFLEVRVSEDERETLKLSADGLSVDIEIRVEPGAQVRVGRPLVSGIERVKERVITRELNERTLGTGALWTPGRQRRLEETLLGLGVFGSVQIESSGGRRLQADASTASGVEVREKDVRISIVERPAGSVEFGPGYRTDLGLIAFSEISYRNLGGWNRGVVGRAQVSRKLDDYQFPEQRYTLVYLEPYLAGLRLKFRASAEYLKEDDVNFVAGKAVSGINREEVTLAFSLERELFDNVRWTHNLYTFSLPRIEAFDETSAARRATYRIGSFGSGLTFDFRDNIFNPSRGFFATTNLEYAAPALGSDRDANFLIWRNGVTTYLPAFRRSTVALYGGYARMTGFGNSEGLPENRRLVLGGRNSVRSLSENFLRFDARGVLDMQSFELKAEFRQPVLLDMGLAFFIDSGRVDVLRYADGSAPGSTGFRTGVGTGLRYTTPVGPLALDLAYNLDRRENENEVKVQFSIGSF